MSSSPADVHLAATGSPVPGDPASARRLFYLLASLALIYAVFAGLRTVATFDLGWQMAIARWIVHHHSVPSVDVLSYTAAGQPWIYPVGAGLVFYVAYLLGGYGLISWLAAAACVGTIALLLRKNTVMGAALAILAVPVIALRTMPRADMFSVVLFAAYLSILWEQHRTGAAKLWLLPVLMVAWVNLHLGFIAGLALLVAYAGTELLEAIASRTKRVEAVQRLHRAAPWLLASVVATLVNPWGWGIYRAIALQQRVESQHVFLLAEWIGLPLTPSAIFNSLSLRQPGGALYILLAIAILAALLALLRAEWGAAILLLGGSYVATRYVRMGAVFACVLVIVAGPILTDALYRCGVRVQKSWVRSAAAAAVAALAVLVAVRCFDLATNRFYLRGATESTFGAGLSWWFPERAAEFIVNNNLPGQVFNSYNEGGFLSWKLGPERLVTIDGRDPLYGAEAIEHNGGLLQSSPDSPAWQQEASRYDLNTIILPLGRQNGIEMVRLQLFCNSTLWKPVYLDQVSAVFVRRDVPHADDLLQRYGVNCATAPLPPQAPSASGAAAFNTWLNSGAVLAALGRYYDALAATEHSLAIFPDSPFAHWLRGSVLAALGRTDEAEAELRTAASLEPSDVTWAALSDFYREHNRKQEAVAAMQHAAALSPKPYSFQSKLAYLYLSANEPKNALRAFEEADHSAPKGLHSADNNTFDVILAQGRAIAWKQLGDLPRAIEFQRQATQLNPNAPPLWRQLAQLYRDAGHPEDANQAELRAITAAQTAPHHP